MARMPGVTWDGEHGGTAMARYDIVCAHTIVGYAPAHAAHFSTRGNGEIIQSRDTRYRSAANKDGNHRVIAIENEDFGARYGPWSGSNVPAFTPEQCEAIARICAWAHQVHGIPLVPCPDSRPGSRGIAYHRQGIDGNFGSFAYGGRVSGGEVWSTSTGKVCPGDRRIHQLINVIIPRAQAIAGGQEADLDATQDARLTHVEKMLVRLFDSFKLSYEHYNHPVWDTQLSNLNPQPGQPASLPAGILQYGTNMGAWEAVSRLAALANDLTDDEAKILAAIRAQPTGGQVDVDALAVRLAPLIPAGATPEQVQEAVRRVFARAGQEGEA